MRFTALIRLIFFPALFMLMISQPCAQTYDYYYGNIHAHSEYSDGNMAGTSGYFTAKPCFLYGKNSLHMDYLGISEHNHSLAGMSIANFHKGLKEADTVNQSGVFSTLYGMEYGVINNGGHCIVYGIDSLIGWETGNYDIYNSEYDYNSLFNKIAAHPGSFAYFAHMQPLDYDSILLKPYNAIWDSAIVGLAMRSGPAFSTDTTYSNPSASTYNARFQDLLKKGYHVSVGMDHDNHYITFGRETKERTVVLAQSLSRADIMDAFRHRRFYASDDWNAKVDYRINGTIMGSTMSSNSNPSLTISVTDPDAEAVSSIKIWYGVPGSGVTATTLTSNTNSATLNFTHSIATGTTFYYYAEITQADGDKMWTAPIWFTKSSAPLPVELLTFSAEKKAQLVSVNWETEAEVNNDYFSLKRSGNDLDFGEIARIKGAGTSTMKHAYAFEDNFPLQGINYYRLDQFDFDGTESSSKTVVVKFSGREKSVTVLSNPVVNHEISFSVRTDNDEEFSTELINDQGNCIYATKNFLSKGIDLYHIPVSSFSNGIYFLKISFHESGETRIAKVEIQR